METHPNKGHQRLADHKNPFTRVHWLTVESGKSNPHYAHVTDEEAELEDGTFNDITVHHKRRQPTHQAVELRIS